MNRFFRLSFLLLALPICLVAEVFTLTDQQGRSMKADVLSLDKNTVKVKREDGMTFDLPLTTLVENDQQTLREWAKREAAKPPSPDAIDVLASRTKFDSSKVETPETLELTYTDGSTRYETRTRVTITERWGYSITLTNRSLAPIKKLSVQYRLFTTLGEQPTKDTMPSLSVESLNPRGNVVLKTSAIPLTKSSYKGTSPKPVGSQLQGIWIRVYKGDTLVKEYSSPETLRLTETW
jgi:hypothetical protein